MKLLDPSTAAGSILLNILATVGAAALLAVLGWAMGPFRWIVQGRRIRRIIKAPRWFKFVYNPSSESMSKPLTFCADGTIGEGRNSNENTWRIRRGRLEILHQDGRLYSRFRHDRDSGRLIHTNEADTRSIQGQYMISQWIKLRRKSVE